jgi:hypothetical protein
LLWDEAEKIRIQRDIANGELSEWKDTLGGYGDGPENVLHWIQGATTRCILSEEYERQIAAGELFTPQTIHGFLETKHDRWNPLYMADLVKFAAERAKEGK